MWAGVVTEPEVSVPRVLEPVSAGSSRLSRCEEAAGAAQDTVTPRAQSGAVPAAAAKTAFKEPGALVVPCEGVTFPGCSVVLGHSPAGAGMALTRCSCFLVLIGLADSIN